jgi:hypothetical protein
MTDHFFDYCKTGDLDKIKECVMNGSAPVQSTQILCDLSYAMMLSIGMGHLHVVQYAVHLGYDFGAKSHYKFVARVRYNENGKLFTAIYPQTVDPDLNNFQQNYWLQEKVYSYNLRSFNVSFEFVNYHSLSYTWKNYHNEIYQYILLLLSKKDFYNNLSKEKYINDTIKKFSPRSKSIKNTHKNNFLKFILKPQSLHMQLIAIE